MKSTDLFGMDKGNVMSSDDEPPTNQPLDNDAQSLSARRARLRGSLAKSMPDPYANTGAATAPPSSAAGSASENQLEEANEEQVTDPALAKSGANIQDDKSDDQKTIVLAPATPANLSSTEEPVNGSSPTNELLAVSPPASSTSSANTDSEDSIPPQSALDAGSAPPTSSQTANAYNLNPAQTDTLINSTAGTFQEQTIDLLTNIDQSISVCAMNLANLQKTTAEQTEALEQLSETMRTQTFSELGLNLNSLMESLSAALEPMKAVGELVPGIDQLVTLMQAREDTTPDAINLTPEQLVMNLADQLSTGQIDPWTFKCAYMAIFPADHPADLLHRLVDLLGTQRLSGELFRAAYDAVQAAEPPPPARRRLSTEIETDSTAQVIQVVPDESLLAELESLRMAQEALQRRDQEREEELAAVTSAKENEMNERWQEFINRHEELTATLKSRDDRLQEREQELAKQSHELANTQSENQQLKAQMEELREQTQEMVKELQKQLNETRQQQEEMKTSAPKSTPGFFDVSPSQEQPATLFDSGPARPLFQQQMQQQNTLSRSQTDTGPKEPPASGVSASATPPTPIAQEPQKAQAPAPPLASAPIPPALPPSIQAIPTAPQQVPISAQPMPRPPVSNSYVSGSGSYGTGVRAQVFEVIVRQALAGAPWREICAGPMNVNNISPDEVEAEVKRRQALLKK